MLDIIQAVIALVIHVVAIAYIFYITVLCKKIDFIKSLNTRIIFSIFMCALAITETVVVILSEQSAFLIGLSLFAVGVSLVNAGITIIISQKLKAKRLVSEENEDE